MLAAWLSSSLHMTVFGCAECVDMSQSSWYHSFMSSFQTWSSSLVLTIHDSEHRILQQSVVIHPTDVSNQLILLSMILSLPLLERSEYSWWQWQYNACPLASLIRRCSVLSRMFAHGFIINIHCRHMPRYQLSYYYYYYYQRNMTTFLVCRGSGWINSCERRTTRTRWSIAHHSCYGLLTHTSSFFCSIFLASFN